VSVEIATATSPGGPSLAAIDIGRPGIDNIFAVIRESNSPGEVDVFHVSSGTVTLAETIVLTTSASSMTAHYCPVDDIATLVISDSSSTRRTHVYERNFSAPILPWELVQSIRRNSDTAFGIASAVFCDTLVVFSRSDIFVYTRATSQDYELVETIDNSVLVTGSSLPIVEATPLGFVVWPSSSGKTAMYYEATATGVELAGSFTLDQAAGFTVFQSFSGNSDREGFTIAASAWIVLADSVVVLMFDPSDFANPVQVSLNPCATVASSRAIMLNGEGVLAQPVISDGNSTLGIFAGNQDAVYLGLGGEFGPDAPNAFAVAGTNFYQTKKRSPGVLITFGPGR
jgi:hypothetical protein